MEETDSEAEDTLEKKYRMELNDSRPRAILAAILFCIAYIFHIGQLPLVSMPFIIVGVYIALMAVIKTVIKTTQICGEITEKTTKSS